MDKLTLAENLGNISANCGYNPYLGYRWRCRLCNSSGVLVALQIPPRLRRRTLPRGTRLHRCNGCRGGWRVVDFKLDRAAAFHRNDILSRQTALDAQSAEAGW